METIKFTKAELNHLVTLIADNEREGTYYGNRKQYWKRSFKLKQKLLLFAVGSSYCNCESLEKELHYGYGLPVCFKCNKVVKLQNNH